MNLGWQAATYLTLVGVVTLNARPASAQTPEARLAPQELGRSHSPAMALGISAASFLIPTLVGATLLWKGDIDNDSVYAGGALLFLGGTVVGPATGHLYTGSWGRAGLFTLARAGTTALYVAAGITAAMGALAGGGGDSTTELAFYTGTLGTLAFDIWECVDAYYTARRLNSQTGVPAVTLHPLVLPPGAAGDRRVGLGVGITASY